MKQDIIANCLEDETRVAVMEDGMLMELGIERKGDAKIVGNIYKGRVENVLPGISSAFINIGLEKNAYLYISDAVDMSQLDVPEKRRTQRSIDQIVKKGDVLMVQVAKEAIGTKGVKISMDISLPGRFLVYMPHQDSIGVSKNIESERERRRLRDLLESMRPKRGGFIVRTEAEGMDEQEMKREVRYLSRLWDNITRRYNHVSAPALVHKDLGIVFQTVRDTLSENTNRFIIDSKSEYEEALEFVQMISPDLASRVQLFDGTSPIFDHYSVEKEVDNLLRSKISLPSGGTIVIQEAESLCAIDVNTGRFTGSQSQEETVTQTNIEAAEEVARQLRLRNIGGIVVIDFIDMRKAKNRQKVVEALESATSRDRAKIKILPITRLGLVEMTRERKRESMLSAVCQICPECDGIGMVLSNESLYVKILREILKLIGGRTSGLLKLVMNPLVADYFLSRKAGFIRQIGRECDILSDGTFRHDFYKIVLE